MEVPEVLVRPGLSATAVVNTITAEAQPDEFLWSLQAFDAEKLVRLGLCRDCVDDGRSGQAWAHQNFGNFHHESTRSGHEVNCAARHGVALIDWHRHRVFSWYTNDQ
jgi:hypothetical protein